MRGFRHILHASDFSAASRPALARALDLARLTRARVTVAHVMSPVVPYVGEGYAVPQVYEQMLADVRTQAQKHLDRVLRKVRAAGIKGGGLLLEGIPADRVVRAARARKADLIVMGTHGHTGLARLMLGSVAARVVATAACPVLTVRARGRAGGRARR